MSAQTRNWRNHSVRFHTLHKSIEPNFNCQFSSKSIVLGLSNFLCLICLYFEDMLIRKSLHRYNKYNRCAVRALNCLCRGYYIFDTGCILLWLAHCSKLVALFWQLSGYLCLLLIAQLVHAWSRHDWDWPADVHHVFSKNGGLEDRTLE